MAKIVKRKVAERVVLRHVASKVVPAFSRRQSSLSTQVFIDRYEDVVEAVLSDSDIVSDILEDLINLGRLEARQGSLYYKGRKIL
jgi:hypothetical protein